MIPKLTAKISRVATLAILPIAVMIAMTSREALEQTPFGPTQCPVNYTCSYQNSSAVPLIGGATDGQPGCAIGSLAFDGEGNFSGVFNGNGNGKVFQNVVLTGTCVSGTSSTLGRINFTAGLSGKPGALAFVTAPNGSHTDILFAGSVLASDTRVIIGTCHGN